MEIEKNPAASGKAHGVKSTVKLKSRHNIAKSEKPQALVGAA
jgi:hypothetical protein